MKSKINRKRVKIMLSIRYSYGSFSIKAVKKKCFGTNWLFINALLIVSKNKRTSCISITDIFYFQNRHLRELKLSINLFYILLISFLKGLFLIWLLYLFENTKIYSGMLLSFSPFQILGLKSLNDKEFQVDIWFKIGVNLITLIWR